MKMIMPFVTFSLLAGLLFGETQPVSLKPASSAIVVVNGIPLTQAQFDARFLEISAFHPKLASLKPAQRTQTEKQIKDGIIPSFIKSRVLVDEARARGLIPSLLQKKQSSDFFTALAKRRGMTLDNYAQTLPGGREELDTRIEEDSLMRALFFAVVEPQISEGVIMQQTAVLQQTLKQGNIDAAATNALFQAELTRTLAAIQSGNHQFNADEQAWEPALSENVETEVVALADATFTPEEEVIEAITQLKTEEWSPVLEQAETFDCFLRLPKKEDEKASSYIRLLIRKDLGFVEPELEELKGDVARSHRQKLQEEFVADLIKNATVIYPGKTETRSSK